MKINGSVYAQFDQQAILPDKKAASQETGATAGQSADSVTINYNAGSGDAQMIDFEEARNILQYVAEQAQNSGDLIAAHNPISADRVMQLLSMEA